MDTFGLLAHGLAGALQPVNLLYALIGVTLGTAVGVLGDAGASCTAPTAAADGATDPVVDVDAPVSVCGVALGVLGDAGASCAAPAARAMSRPASPASSPAGSMPRPTTTTSAVRVDPSSRTSSTRRR